MECGVDHEWSVGWTMNSHVHRVLLYDGKEKRERERER